MSDNFERGIKPPEKQRIQIIDALRGLSVLLMVVHHAFYDATALLGAPLWLFTNPVFDVLHYFFAGVFVFLAGVSSRFSRSNLKRGLLCAAAAAAVSFAGYLVGEAIWFGILHLLASCMLLYAAAERMFAKFRTIHFAAGVLTGLILSALLRANAPFLFPGSWIFGWTPPGFASADYFPLFPWIFVFALGAWAGYYIKERRLPEWFYSAKIPFLPPVGRRSLLIYLIHQPVLYGAAWLIARYILK